MFFFVTTFACVGIPDDRPITVHDKRTRLSEVRTVGTFSAALTPAARTNEPFSSHTTCRNHGSGGSPRTSNARARWTCGRECVRAIGRDRADGSARSRRARVTPIRTRDAAKRAAVALSVSRAPEKRRTLTSLDPSPPPSSTQVIALNASALAQVRTVPALHGTLAGSRLFRRARAGVGGNRCYASRLQGFSPASCVCG